MDKTFSLFEWKKTEAAFVFGVLLFIFGISYFQVKLGEMKTRDAQRVSDVEMVSRGLRRFRDDHGFVPLEATGSGRLLSCGSLGTEECDWGTGRLVDEQEVTYVNLLPGDPLENKGFSYMYEASADRKNFKIYVALENPSDKKIKRGLTKQCGINVQCNWYVEE